MRSLGVPKETGDGERRVACVPADVTKYRRMGFAVSVQAGAGAEAGARVWVWVRACECAWVLVCECVCVCVSSVMIFVFCRFLGYELREWCVMQCTFYACVLRVCAFA